MHPNNKFERNNIKKKLFNYYEFGKPLSYIQGKHWKHLKAACKRYWNRKIRREDAYNDAHIKIGKRYFSGEDFGGI